MSRVPGRAPVPGQPGVNVDRPAKPLVVAHRGASVEYPENTIEAFEAAIGSGDAVEFDVRMTADGHAVVMHDPDVSRTTDGTGLVSEMTLDEIRTLGVPTLEEALACLSGRAAADIEVKNLPRSRASPRNARRRWRPRSSRSTPLRSRVR